METTSLRLAFTNSLFPPLAFISPSTMAFTAALTTLHEKAIYIVEGTLYQVEKLDFENRKAFVRQVECDYYTDAIRYDRVTILDTFETASAGREDQIEQGFSPAHHWSHGEVHVVSRVVGFKKI